MEKIASFTAVSYTHLIIFVMAFTPLGYFQTMGLSITFLTVPVAVGAIILGPKGGAICGLAFGITSFMQCFGMGAFGTMLFSINPLGTAFVCIVPRLLEGLLCGLDVYKRQAMTIAGVVLAVIIVIIMLLLFSKVLGIGKKSNTDTSDSQQTEQSADEEDDSSSASQGNTVNMPSLLGKTYAEARTVLEELGLKIERGESEKSNQYSAGQIIAQSEESGNSVKVGTTAVSYTHLLRCFATPKISNIYE